MDLDVHGLPGSQNGWNYSGRQGAIGQLNDMDGGKNAERSLEMHGRLSKVFAQDRYKNVIAFYGLANEPKMTELASEAVVSWTQDADEKVRGNGIEVDLAFGDGFMGLKKWKGKLTGLATSRWTCTSTSSSTQTKSPYTHRKKIEYAPAPAGQFRPKRAWTPSRASASCSSPSGRWPTRTRATCIARASALELRCPTRVERRSYVSERGTRRLRGESTGNS